MTRILWLHGGNVAGWMWGQQLPAFTDHENLVPDLPGFGANSGLAWQSIAATADWVAEVLDGGPAHVVGLSLGASVAIELEFRHPHLVSSLFLASTQAVRPTLAARALARAMLAFWNKRAFWVTLARSYGLTGDDATLFIETGLDIRRETAVAIFEEVAAGLAIERIAAPALAIAGEKDAGAVASLAVLEPHALTAIAPGMHHQWNIENVELFNSSLREWLSTGTTPSALGTRI